MKSFLIEIFMLCVTICQQLNPHKYSPQMKSGQKRVLLGKYEMTKILGKAKTGDCYQVEDKNQRNYAVKLMKKDIMKMIPQVREYLLEERDKMMKMNSPYIVKLQKFEETKNSYYFFYEYCQEDLLYLQRKQEEKIFHLDSAVEILVEVMKGLEDLHKVGYRHMDLKSQNILISEGPNNQKIIKLTDYNICRKDVLTILKTNSRIEEHFKYDSPTSLYGEQIGFSTQIWSFGILFFFMLNMEFPFKSINPHQYPHLILENLFSMSASFSFKEKVMKTKKRRLENCTPEMEDLFKRIFTLNPYQRISWLEIRQHPVFQKYFPVISQETMELYQQRGTDNKYNLFIQRIKEPKEEEIQIPCYFIENMKEDKKFQKFSFLLDLEEGLRKCSMIPEEMMNCLRYLLIRLSLCLFNEIFERKEEENELHYLEVEGFEKIKQSIEAYLFFLHRKAFQHYQFTSQITSYEKIFSVYFHKDYYSNFKEGYKTIFKMVYAYLRKLYRGSDQAKYYIAITTICYYSPLIIEQSDEEIKNLFPSFFEESDQEVNFLNLMKKIEASSYEDRKKIICSLTNIYSS